MAKKKDSSPVIHQRDKLKNNLVIKEFPWTEKQKELIEIILNKDTKAVLIKGPAGSSKTLVSVFCGLRLLSEKRISDILYIRSAVESSESKIGYLPGSVEDKLHFYNLPFIDKLEELLTKPEIQRLEAENRISVYPPNYARGMSWNAKFILADEMQNSSLKEIITILTRIGKFSKCILLADPSQTDLTPCKSGGFEKVWESLSDEDSKAHGIQTFEFTDDDILRSELVKFLVKKFKSLKISV